jgi:diaminopimelate epimerase
LIPFHKYHGTGNDFILIDNRDKIIKKNEFELFKGFCDRHTGIGADGIMLLENAENKEYDFNMFYANADGRESTMCGNGGRCMIAFAKKLGLIQDQAKFLASDGDHTAKISAEGLVKLKMGVCTIHKKSDLQFVGNTGSPHAVILVNPLKDFKVYQEGNRIRNSPEFISEGINVNFLETISPKEAFVRTYERGVEDETLSCGTGVTAAAIVLAMIYQETGTLSKTIHTLGGDLLVCFNRLASEEITEVYLEGPTQFVFSGIWNESDKQ